MGLISSGVASTGARGAEYPLDSEKFAEKEGKNQEKEGKIAKKLGRKGKNQEGCFTLPLLTDRTGYATAN